MPGIAIIPTLTKATSSPCSVAGLRHYPIHYLGLRIDDFVNLSLTKNRCTNGISAYKLTLVLEQAPDLYVYIEDLQVEKVLMGNTHTHTRTHTVGIEKRPQLGKNSAYSRDRIL